jgi:hypothetical protein
MEKNSFQKEKSQKNFFLISEVTDVHVVDVLFIKAYFFDWEPYTFADSGSFLTLANSAFCAWNPLLLYTPSISYFSFSVNFSNC